MFYLCRPVLIDEDGDEDDPGRILQGGEWDRERWWYKIAQVCRRWRYLILGSASHLGLCLVCTYGTPVADMLAYSRPLPLIIDHVDKHHDITAEDEESIILALRHRECVRCICLLIPVPNSQKLVAAIDKEFLALDYLYIGPPTKHNTILSLPKTFRAPYLRHLILINMAFPIGGSLLTSAADLVTLSLQLIHPSAYFPLNHLLQRLSSMPQLEVFGGTFHSPLTKRAIGRHLTHTSIMTHVSLPNLRWFTFGGETAYLEALLPRIHAPLIEKFQIFLVNELTLSIPHLLQFMSDKENLKFGSAWLAFHEDGFSVWLYPYEGARMYSFYLEIGGRHLDWQVASAAQIFYALRTLVSTVVFLTLAYGRHHMSSEWHNEADRAEWHKILQSFCDVKTLVVRRGLIKAFSRSLLVYDEDPPAELLLPELNELLYSAGDGAADGWAEEALTPFINARQNAGRPVALIGR